MSSTKYGVVEERGIPIGRIPEEGGAIVTVIGLLAKFTEGSYKGGRKAAIVLEGSNARVDGIMWDDALTEQRTIGIPPIGWPVAVTAKVGIREFEQEDDEGNITLVKIRQLTVRRIDVINLDDPVTGSLPTDVVVPVLDQIPEPEAAPEVVEPEYIDAPMLAIVEEPDFTVTDELEPDFDDVPDLDGVPTFTRPQAGARKQQDIISVIPERLRESKATVSPGRVGRNTSFTYAARDGRVIAQVELVA